MSQEAVEIVRGFNEPHEGRNLLLLIREALDSLGPDPQAEAVLAWWANDPGWRHAHPNLEWDLSGTGALGTVPQGPLGLVQWWATWLEVWASYAYRILEYRDLGAWVLTPTQIQARGRDGLVVEMTVFQLWQIRDGKVAVLRAFLTEREALEAAGAHA